MSNIEDRIIEDEHGRVILLKEAPPGGIVLVRGADGRTRRMLADPEVAAAVQLSMDNATAKRKPKDKPPVSAVVTRSEASTILGLSIEDTAKVIDENDVGKHLAYDRLHIEAIRDARAKGQRSGTIKTQFPGSHNIVLDPLPDP